MMTLNSRKTGWPRQLKCMLESYKLLGMRVEELQAEVNLLRVKTENFSNEFQEERSRHQDALARCKDLQEQLQRLEYLCQLHLGLTTCSRAGLLQKLILPKRFRERYNNWTKKGR